VSVADDDRDYFPLENDRRWVYRMRGAVVSKELLAQVMGTEALDGQECFLVDRNRVRTWYSVDAKGVQLHRTSSESGVEEYDPPELILKFGSKKGDRWQAGPGAEVATFENRGNETVQVPAGMLPAIRVVRSWTVTDIMRCELHRWFVKGVGIAREDMVINGTVGTVLELAFLPHEWLVKMRESTVAATLEPAAPAPAKSDPVSTWRAGEGATDLLDWLFDLRTAKGIDYIRDSLLKVQSTPSADVADCQIALLAAECVACLRGSPADLHEDARSFIARSHLEADQALVDLAIGVVDRIATASSLRQSWKENRAAAQAEWLQALTNLQGRIRGKGRATAQERGCAIAGVALALTSLVVTIVAIVQT